MVVENAVAGEVVPVDEMAILLRFLGRLWLRELDAASRSELLGEMAEPWQALGGSLPTESLEDLQADFCQLFSHPKSYIAPFQSVWTTGQLDGRPAQSMRQYLRETGYESQIGVDEVSDHLGLQLDLAGWMLSQVGSEGDGLVQEVATRFVAEHLSWPLPMLERGELSVAQTDFYRSLMRITRDTLELLC